MRRANILKEAKITHLIASALLIVTGITLMAWADIAPIAVRYLVAIGFAVIGLARVLGYFANDLYRLAFQYDLAIGSLSVILAVLIFIYPNNLMAILPFGTGIYVLSDALFKLQTAIDAKLFGMRQWVGLLTASLIASAAGIISLIVAVLLQEPTILVGIAITADGALNFFNTMATVRVGAQKKHRIKDQDDAEKPLRGGE